MNARNRSQLLSLAIAIAGLFPFSINAQQDPMYTMYMWNMMAINPAYAGSADVLNVTALSRAQWANIPGAPVTHSISAHAPVNRQSLALGMGLVSDRIGRTGTSSAFGDVAYRTRITPKMRLSFGLKFGLNHAQVNNTQLQNIDPEDPLFLTDQSDQLVPNFGAGIYLWSTRSYLGVSVPKLRRNYLGSVENENSNTLFAQESPHLFITGGYVIECGTVKIKPAFMLRMTEGAPPSGDLSVNVLLRDRFWIGSAYRNGSNVSGIFSIQLNDQFRAGYAYDLCLDPLMIGGRSSQEIMLSYDPIFNRDRIRSPRYF